MKRDTARQIAALSLRRDRPLVICDVDEVIVHFVAGFEEWLGERGLYLAPDSWSLEGNVRRLSDGEALADVQVRGLVHLFFMTQVHALRPIEGAVEALHALARDCEVVLLTNLPHVHRRARITNLRRIGLPWPVITNSGPKGPAVRHLAERTGEACVFIDDHTGFLESAGRHAPAAHLFHFLHDPRFARHAGWPEVPHERVSDWRQTESGVRRRIGDIGHGTGALPFWDGRRNA